MKTLLHHENPFKLASSVVEIRWDRGAALWARIRARFFTSRVGNTSYYDLTSPQVAELSELCSAYPPYCGPAPPLERRGRRRGSRRAGSAEPKGPTPKTRQSEPAEPIIHQRADGRAVLAPKLPAAADYAAAGLAARLAAAKLAEERILAQRYGLLFAEIFSAETTRVDAALRCAEIGVEVAENLRGSCFGLFGAPTVPTPALELATGLSSSSPRFNKVVEAADGRAGLTTRTPPKSSPKPPPR